MQIPIDIKQDNLRIINHFRILPLLRSLTRRKRIRQVKGSLNSTEIHDLVQIRRTTTVLVLFWKKEKLLHFSLKPLKEF